MKMNGIGNKNLKKISWNKINLKNIIWLDEKEIKLLDNHELLVNWIENLNKEQLDYLKNNVSILSNDKKNIILNKKISQLLENEINKNNKEDINTNNENGIDKDFIEYIDDLKDWFYNNMIQFDENWLDLWISISYKKIQNELRFTDYWDLLKEIVFYLFWDNKDSNINKYIKFLDKDWKELKNSMEDNLNIFKESFKKCDNAIDESTNIIFNISNEVLKMMKAQRDEYFTNIDLIPKINTSLLEKNVYDIWSWLWFWGFKNINILKNVNLIWLEYNEKFIEIWKILKKFLWNIIDDSFLDNYSIQKYDVLNEELPRNWEKYSIIWNPPFWKNFQKSLIEKISNSESGSIIIPKELICKIFDAKMINWKWERVSNVSNINDLQWFESKNWIIDYLPFVDDIKSFTWQAWNSAWVLVNYYKNISE